MSLGGLSLSLLVVMRIRTRVTLNFSVSLNEILFTIGISFRAEALPKTLSLAPF